MEGQKKGVETKPDPNTRIITKAELREHNTADSCWLAIANRVYDVTRFLEKHPGGEEIILEESGGYATKAFRDVRHSQYANNLLKRYQIGVLAEEDREKLGVPKNEEMDGSAGCVDLCCQGCSIV